MVGVTCIADKTGDYGLAVGTTRRRQQRYDQKTMHTTLNMLNIVCEHGSTGRQGRNHG